MTEAARRIHTSQPQVSRLISQLEEITGFALFNRSGSRLSPTVEGERFFKEVEQTFAGLTALEAAASRIKAFSAGRLIVAAMPRLAGGILARAVSEFKSQHPDVMVAIHSGDATSVHAWVSSGQCDIGLAMLYGEAPGVCIEPVAGLECVAILPPAHPLTSRAELEPADFDGQPFVSFPSGSALRKRVDNLFAMADVSPVVVAEASLGASVSALVATGLGISLINHLAAAEEQARSRLEIRRFRPVIAFDIVLTYPEGQARSRLVDAFSAFARRMIRDELQRLGSVPAP